MVKKGHRQSRIVRTETVNRSPTDIGAVETNPAHAAKDEAAKHEADDLGDNCFMCGVWPVYDRHPEKLMCKMCLRENYN